MILVTGAAGLSGSIVINEFVRRGAPVRALVRDRTKAGRLESLPGVQVVEGDMARPETLGAALDGIDRALMISTSNEAMVDTQCTFIDTAQHEGVTHLVKYSGKESPIGFDSNNFRFARMHDEIEHYLENAGLEWTQLRPSQFMQVYFREVPTIMARDAFYLPMADVRLSPVDIADVAQVAYSILTNPEDHESARYDMTGPEALTGNEIAAHLSNALGRPIRYVPVTAEQARMDWLGVGMPPERADALGELFAERRRHPDSRIDLSTHEKFGITPTSFADFAVRNAAVFRGETP